MNKTPYNAPQGFNQVVSLAGWDKVGDCVQLDGMTASGKKIPVRLACVSDNIWRYTVYPGHSDPVGPTPLNTSLQSSSSPLSIHDSADSLVLRCGRTQIRIQKNSWSLSVVDESNCVLLRENGSDVDGLGRPFVLPLGVVEYGGNVTRVTHSFFLHPDEAIFGLGEKFTPLNKVGQKIVSWNLDALGSTSERSHKNIPLVLSTRGYGLYVHTGARVTWELGTQSCQSYSFSVEDSGLDVFILTDPTLAGLLRHYTDLTGHAPLPPKWSFGLWVSSGGTYRDERTMTGLVDGLESHAIPADVVHIDPWWMKWRRYCDFQWDREAFPHVEQFIARLHSLRLRVCLWEHPYISVESDLFEFGSRRGYFVKRTDGSVYVIQYGLSLAPRPDGVVRDARPEDSWNAPVAIIDLTNQEAYAWFQELHRPLLRMGIDTFKTDFGEDIPADAVFSDGTTGSTMHNLYPLLYNRAVFEVIQQEHGKGIVWSRSGTAGNQRYPVCWSGDPAADFESLACTIRGGLSAGLSGIPFWSNDIGGYRGKPSPLLYVRWAQFGLLCSHSRMHGDSPREPWIFGKETTEIVRRHIRLRYQLFPYLYSCAHEAARTGMPVLRAMPLAFQDDINTYDKDFQFLLGPWFLVAPVYTEDSIRNVYLPAGEWIDYWSLEHRTGPAVLRICAPIEIIPLYVRAGAIIPLMKDADRIPDEPVDPLILEIHPTDYSSYELLEDAGPTMIECRQDNTGIDITIDGRTRRCWILRFRRLDKKVRVRPESLAHQSIVQDVTHNAALEAIEISLRATSSATLKIEMI